MLSDINKFSKPLLIQWGVYSGTQTNITGGTIQLPLSYSTFYVPVCTPYRSTLGYTYDLEYYGTVSMSSFNVSANTTSFNSIYWLTVGY